MADRRTTRTAAEGAAGTTTASETTTTVDRTMSVDTDAVDAAGRAPGADDDAEEGTRTYHVARRHDSGAVEYDTADAIARGGPGAARRQSTRKMRPDDAAPLVRMGVLSESKPDAAAVAPSVMVSDPRGRTADNS